MNKIVSLQAFSDNYIWVLINSNSTAVVVDPGDAAPVLNYLNENQLTLAAIFITHHHYDHTDGITALLNHKKVPVYGGWNEPISHLSHPLREGDTLDLDHCRMGKYRVLEIPGHTLGHIAYVGEGRVFSGDTLFTAGCGKIFEGTAPQMFNSLQKLKSLPVTTEVFCGHEYTLANLKFAQVVEPENQEIKKRLEKVREQRENGVATVPATMELELKTNPFLRTHEAAVVLAAERHAGRTLRDEVEVFAEIRHWKNGFKP